MDTDKSSPMTPLLIKRKGRRGWIEMVQNHPLLRDRRSKMHPWSGFAEYLFVSSFEILIASAKAAGNDLGPSVAISGGAATFGLERARALLESG